MRPPFIQNQGVVFGGGRTMRIHKDVQVLGRGHGGQLVVNESGSRGFML